MTTTTTTTTIRYNALVAGGPAAGMRERIGVVASRASDPEARWRSLREGERVVLVKLEAGGCAWMRATDLRVIVALEYIAILQRDYAGESRLLFAVL